MIKAHRLSYILFKGPIPEGLLVCHRCDNPICVNPDHLFVGTEQDNMDDKVAKGRHFRVLSDIEIAVIKAAYIPRHKDFCFRALAEKFGVSEPTIYNAVTKY